MSISSKAVPPSIFSDTKQRNPQVNGTLRIDSIPVDDSDAVNKLYTDTVASSRILVLDDNNIYVGNTSLITQGVTLSGLVTSTNTGVITLTDTGVTSGSYTTSDITVDSTGRITNVITGLETLTDSEIFVGNSSNISTPVTVSGDITITNTGVVSLVNTGITPGSYNNANVTVNNKGLITAIIGSSGLTDSEILVGNASNVPTSVSMSGDATISNTGVVTLAKTILTLSPGRSYNNTNLTVDSKGRITALEKNSNSGGYGTIDIGEINGGTSGFIPVTGYLTSCNKVNNNGATTLTLVWPTISGASINVFCQPQGRTPYNSDDQKISTFIALGGATSVGGTLYVEKTSPVIQDIILIVSIFGYNPIS